MKFLLQWVVLFFLSVFSFNSYAGTQNPLTATQVGNLPATTEVGHSYAVNFVITSHLPFTMPSALFVVNASTPANEISLVDGCSNKRLAANESCTVGLVFSPTSAGQKSIHLFMEYGRNKVPFPQPPISTQTVSQSSPGLDANVIVGLPPRLITGGTYPIRFEYTNTGNVTLTGLVLTPGSDNAPVLTTVSNTCTGTLNAGESCAFNATLTPTATSGVANISETLANSQLSAKANTSGVISNTPTFPFTVSFISGPSNSFGPEIFNMVPNSTQQLEFYVSSNVSGTNIVNCSLTTSPYDSTNFNSAVGCANPNGQALPPSFYMAFIITSGAGGSTPINVTHTLTVEDDSGVNVVNIPLNYTLQPNSNRTLTFENFCTFNVYLGVTSGAVSPNISCSTNSDCPGNSSGATYCNTVANPSVCFWTNPTPTASGQSTYLLNANGANTITLPITDYSSVLPSTITNEWSGGFAARTGCSFSGGGVISCDTADCGDNGSGTGACTPGVGFATPSAQTEVTFNVKTPDFFDVTLINGFNNVAASMTPNFQPNPNQPYDCGAAGGTESVNYSNQLYPPNGSPENPPTGTLSGCPWTFTPPSSNPAYQWIINPTATSCTANSGCGGGLVCGLSKTAVGTTPSVGSTALFCGTFVGYWTQDEICATNFSYNPPASPGVTPVVADCTADSVNPPTPTSTAILAACTAPGTNNNCPVTITAATPVYTLTNLLGGTGGGPPNSPNPFDSCYLTQQSGNYSSTNCAGCTNWQSTAGFTGQVPTDPSLVQQCDLSASAGTTFAAPNPLWQNQVLPGLVWLKNACPRAYSWVFDDKTSTFVCPYGYAGGQGGTNYAITFCPENAYRYAKAKKTLQRFSGWPIANKQLRR